MSLREKGIKWNRRRTEAGEGGINDKLVGVNWFKRIRLAVEWFLIYPQMRWTLVETRLITGRGDMRRALCEFVQNQRQTGGRVWKRKQTTGESSTHETSEEYVWARVLDCVWCSPIVICICVLLWWPDEVKWIESSAGVVGVTSWSAVCLFVFKYTWQDGRWVQGKKWSDHNMKRG